MAMSNGGLTKLIEECGELVQIAAKKIAYPTKAFHPDGLGRSIDERLEDEMADVLAAIYFVRDKIGLSDHDINARMVSKSEVFKRWDKD
jgi:NTP pyrophosphatase (non-canonical NTP hydrolase)